MHSFIRLSTLAVFIVLGSGAWLASAQTTTPTTSPASAPHDTATTPLPGTTTPTPSTTTGQAELNDQTQQRITNLAANIANRIDAANTRLTHIANRLEQRLDKLEAAGTDTSEARLTLESAQTVLRNTTQTAATLDQRIFSTVTSENPNRDWLELRLTIRNLKQNLQIAKSDLLTSARSAQSTPPPMAPTATSTSGNQ